jgi:hypothetical protein
MIIHHFYSTTIANQLTTKMYNVNRSLPAFVRTINSGLTRHDVFSFTPFWLNASMLLQEKSQLTPQDRKWNRTPAFVICFAFFAIHTTSVSRLQSNDVSSKLAENIFSYRCSGLNRFDFKIYVEIIFCPKLMSY